MKAMWGAKTPDRAKIEEYHKARVDSIAAEIVRSTVQKMYPGYAKGGSAAGRIAAKAVKTTATAVADVAAAKNTAVGKPTYVAAKPAWESIDWDKDPKQLLYITGKAYLKTGGKLVTWRK
jgi:high-affinity K+ transport system ATPase subunit B